jgi:hypothetical protein
MRLTRSIAVLLLAPLVLGACVTGKRPSFGVQSDPAIAAVLSKLDVASIGPFTATYSLLTRFGNVTTPATVAMVNTTQRSVTIGGVRYLFGDAGPQTCALATGSCTAQTDDAQVSNLSLTHDFYGAAPAARIRQDAKTMVGNAIGSTEQIAGQTATCVQIPFTGGSKKYCTLDDGLLAFQDSPDLQITLLTVIDTTNPLLFTTSTVAP